MKRTKLNKNQIKKVVELRQREYSFLAIERDTKIPRRVAQRAYLEWEEKSSWEDLKRVRSDVVDREFSQHLDLLTNLAQQLVAGMDVWISGDIPPRAEDHLVAIWRDEIEGSLGVYLNTSYYDKRTRTRLERQHQMLFKALKQHTVKGVPWAVLEEWQASWDRYRTALQDLKEQLSAMVNQRLKKEPVLWKGITPFKSDLTVAELMTQGIIKVLLTKTVEKTGQDEVFAWEIRPFEDAPERRILVQGKLWMLQVKTPDQAETVKAKYESMVNELWDSKPMQSLRRQSKMIQEAADTLDAALDPLRLRPLILNSRCDLCPV